MIGDWLIQHAKYVFQPSEGQAPDYRQCIKKGLRNRRNEDDMTPHYGLREVVACLDFVRTIKGVKERVQVMACWESPFIAIMAFHSSELYTAA